MSLSSTTSRVSYPGAGLTGPFAVPFRFFAASDLRVIRVDSLGVEVVLTLNVHYTVAGVGDDAGTVTLTDALAVGDTLVVRRSPPLTQPMSIQNQGSYFPKTIEDEIDRLAMQLQALQDMLDRSFGFREGIDPAGKTTRVTPVAGRVLGFTDVDTLDAVALDASADVILPAQGRTVSTLTAYLGNNVQGFNVKDFGATGDGVTDDTAALVAARDAAYAHGLPMLLPSGDYVLKATLDVTSVSVIGVGIRPVNILAYVSLGFAGTKVLFIDGDAGLGGASGPQQYENFTILGDALGAVDGFLIRGNALDNRFRCLRFSTLSGVGIKLSDDPISGNGPNVNVFEFIQMQTLGGHGMQIDSGQNNIFRLIDIESVGGDGVHLTAGAVGTRRVLLEQLWLEVLGAGANGIYASGQDELTIRNCLISGYGHNPATTGHGIHLNGCSSTIIDGAAITGRAASAAGSRKIRVEGGTGTRIHRVTSMTTADIEITAPATDTIIHGTGTDVRIQNVTQLVTSNAHADLAAAGATRYLQPGTGFDAAAEADVAVRIVGRLSIRGMHIKCSDPGVGKSYSVYLMKNGVATALASAPAHANFDDVSDTTDQIDFVDGDTYSFRIDTDGGSAVIPRGKLRVSVGMIA